MKWGHRKSSYSSIVSTQKRKLPGGVIIDGYQKRKKLPIGTKVDGPGLDKPNRSRLTTIRNERPRKLKLGSKKKSETISEYRKVRNKQQKHMATKRAVQVGAAVVNNILSSGQVVNSTSPRTVNKAATLVNHMLDRKYVHDAYK